MVKTLQLMGYVNWNTTLSVNSMTDFIIFRTRAAQEHSQRIYSTSWKWKPGRNPIFCHYKNWRTAHLGLASNDCFKTNRTDVPNGSLPTIHLMVVPSPKLTDKAPENVYMPKPKRKVVSLPSFFRCENVSFGADKFQKIIEIQAIGAIDLEKYTPED